MIFSFFSGVFIVFIAFASYFLAQSLLSSDFELEHKLQVIVSCLMPTRNRAALVAEAIKRLQDQRLPHHLRLQLVIVDQSDHCDDKDAFDQSLSWVAHFCVSPAWSIGEMRNFGISKATGMFVIHVDDDELYREDRIWLQIEPMLERGDDVPDITALPFARLLHTDSCQVTEFEPLPPDEDDDDDEILHSPHFGSIAYRRDMFGEDRSLLFPNSSFAEDYAMVERAFAAGHSFKVLRDDDDVMLHVRHSNNANRELTQEALSQMRPTPPPPWISDLDLTEFCNSVNRAL